MVVLLGIVVFVRALGSLAAILSFLRVKRTCRFSLLSVLTDPDCSILMLESLGSERACPGRKARGCNAGTAPQQGFVSFPLTQVPALASARAYNRLRNCCGGEDILDSGSSIAELCMASPGGHTLGNPGGLLVFR